MDDEKHAEVTYDPTASNQDPFFTIVAPNLDGISRNSFQRGSVSRRVEKIDARRLSTVVRDVERGEERRRHTAHMSHDRQID
jgi:hypothetical protein